MPKTRLSFWLASRLAGLLAFYLAGSVAGLVDGSISWQQAGKFFPVVTNSGKVDGNGRAGLI